MMNADNLRLTFNPGTPIETLPYVVSACVLRRVNLSRSLVPTAQVSRRFKCRRW